MSDSLQIVKCNKNPINYNIININNNQHMSTIKFAKLYSPRMKSVYWRYFGYPTTEDDCIITKQNIVCTICFKVLTNHGNTTNLRAHLQYRHKDIFNEIVTENRIILPQRKSQPRMNVHIKQESDDKHKIKKEYVNTSQSANISPTDYEEHSVLYESVVPMTYDDDDGIDNNHFTKIDVNTIVDMKRKPLQILYEPSNDVEYKYFEENTVTSVSNSNEVVYSYQLQEALTNLIVQDMLNIERVYDMGMSQLLRTLSTNIPIPPPDMIETFIREIYSDKHTSIVDEIKMHSQTKPFSLGFELWINVENRQFLSVYYNFTTDAPDYNLINQLYCTVEYNKFCSCDEIFEHFNMQNCTAAIVNSDCNNTLNTFLKNKNIPIILSCNVIIDYCLKEVFALPAVAAIIEEIKEVVMRYYTELSAKDVDIPRINADFPWTYYELLKFFTEYMFWSEEVDVLMESAKGIVDCLNTLSIITDTIKGEEIPLGSMILPITRKILHEKLTITPEDDQFVICIKTIIINKLTELILSDVHLTIAALLDPRFHRLITVENVSNCLHILSEKLHKSYQVQQYDEVATTAITLSESGVNDVLIKREDRLNEKKSNLEIFFDLTDATTSYPVYNITNINSELKRYRAEVNVTLDESPFLWWHKMGHLYDSLKNLALMYQCVPCTVNMDFRKSIKEQIVHHQKRFMLSGKLVEVILFLHYNK